MARPRLLGEGDLPSVAGDLPRRLSAAVLHLPLVDLAVEAAEVDSEVVVQVAAETREVVATQVACLAAR